MVRQILRDHCKRESSILKMMVNLIARKFFQYSQRRSKDEIFEFLEFYWFNRFLWIFVFKNRLKTARIRIKQCVTQRSLVSSDRTKWSRVNCRTIQSKGEFNVCQRGRERQNKKKKENSRGDSKTNEKTQIRLRVDRQAAYRAFAFFFFLFSNEKDKRGENYPAILFFSNDTSSFLYSI